MLKKTVFLLPLIAVFAVFPLSAAGISFLVIETGLPEGSPSSPYSALWENSLLDVFFESGHIVTNAPILRLPEKPADVFPDEAERDFNDAKTGGMQYFLIAVVDHHNPNVSLCLFSIRTQLLVQRQVHEGTSFRPGKEEQENIKRTIGAMAAQIR